MMSVYIDFWVNAEGFGKDLEILFCFKYCIKIFVIEFITRICFLEIYINFAF